MEVFFISQHVRENSGLGQTCLIPVGSPLALSLLAQEHTEFVCSLSMNLFQSSEAGVLSPTQSWSLQFTWQHGSGEEEEEQGL